jgi:hypothetical protein
LRIVGIGGSVAYIDPGSTNFIIMALVAAAGAIGLTVATFWRRIRAFFGRNSGKASKGQ